MTDSAFEPTDAPLTAKENTARPMLELQGPFVRLRPSDLRIGMPRYIFETNDNGQIYETELEADNDQAAREAIIAAFPDIARSQLSDGAKRMFSGTVRNEQGKVIYRAMLSFFSETGSFDENVTNVHSN